MAQQEDFNSLMLKGIIGSALGDLKKIDMLVSSYQDSLDYDVNSQPLQVHIKTQLDAQIEGMSALVKGLYVGSQDSLQEATSAKVDELSGQYKLDKVGGEMTRKALVPKLEAILKKQLRQLNISVTEDDDVVSVDGSTDSEHFSESSSEVRLVEPSRRKKRDVTRRARENDDIDEPDHDDVEHSIIKRASPSSHSGSSENEQYKPTRAGGNFMMPHKDDYFPPHPYYDKSYNPSNQSETDNQLKGWGKGLLSNPVALLFFAFFVLFSPMVIVIPTLVAMGVVMNQEQKQNLSVLKDEIKSLNVDRRAMQEYIYRLQSDDMFTSNNPFKELDVNKISDDEFSKANNSARAYRRNISSSGHQHGNSNVIAG